MKKKILSLLLILIICFPTNLAFAADTAIDLDTAETVSQLTTHVITTGSDDDLETYKGYTISIPAETKEVILPITFDQKGLFYSAAAFTVEKKSLYLDETIYSDANCTQEIKYSSYNYKAVIPNSGTYYIKLSVSDYSSDKATTTSYEVKFASQFYSGEEKTLVNKEWTCSGNIDTATPLYYKVEVSKTGSLTIDTVTEYSNTITLCNSSKKSISEDVYNSDGKVLFAVKKGTYYIKVKTSSDALLVKSSFSAVSDKSGSSKSKALKLNAGKSYTSCITATDKKGTSDWYKITLTKSQVVKIKLTGNVSSGDIKYEFFGGNISGSITGYLSSVGDDETFQAETYSSSKLPKGTYYIKVYKDDNLTSGDYTIGLKK